jgi:hypothetical protein
MLESLMLPISSSTAEKLLVLTHILGKDGQKFVTVVEKVLKTYPFKKGDEQRMRMSMKEVAAYWTTRQKMGQVAFNEYYDKQMVSRAKAKEAMYAKASTLAAQTLRAFDTWVAEELLQVSVTKEEDETQKRVCASCGTKEKKEETALLTCGRCMAALYCDRDCQRIHWKQEHKSECVAKTSSAIGGDGKES